MTKSNLSYWKVPALTGLLLLFVLLLIWVLVGIVPRYWYGSEEAAQFGDSFGFVNSLLSGLAVAGAMFAIILQTLELREQRNELQESQQTWSAQSDAMLLSAYAQLLLSGDLRDPRKSYAVRSIENLLAERIAEENSKRDGGVLGPVETFSESIMQLLHQLERILSPGENEINEGNLKAQTLQCKKDLENIRSIYLIKFAKEISIMKAFLQEFIDVIPDDANGASRWYLVETSRTLVGEIRKLFSGTIDTSKTKVKILKLCRELAHTQERWDHNQCEAAMKKVFLDCLSDEKFISTVEDAIRLGDAICDYRLSLREPTDRSLHALGLAKQIHDRIDDLRLVQTSCNQLREFAAKIV